MPLIQLKSHQNDNILYEGHFDSLAACTEQAILEGVSLEKVNLKNANLINANLDDANLTGALLSGANLSGANLSESVLRGAHMAGASLYNSCLCYSDLSFCNFEDASFGGTDITGANISESRFSTLSSFSLNFTFVENMEGCVFKDPGGTLCRISRPPIVINGLQPTPIILMDHHVKIGSDIKPYNEWLSLMMTQYLPGEHDR